MQFNVYGLAVLGALAANTGLALASDLDAAVPPPPPPAPPIQVLAPPPVVIPPPPPPPAAPIGGFYGNVNLESGADASPSVTASLPFISGGGRVAYDGGIGTFGFQGDLQGYYQNLSWRTPAAVSTSFAGGNGPAFTGASGEIDSALHLTYQMDDAIKFGGFGSLSYFSNSENVPTGYTSAPIAMFQGVGSMASSMSGGTSNVTGNYTSWNSQMALAGLGGEGLWTITPNTTVQLRLAGVTRVLSQSTLSSAAAGTVTTGNWQLNLSDWGGVGSVGVNHRLTDKWMLHGDFGLMGLNLGTTSTTELAWGAIGGADYCFESIPLSIGLQGGYESFNVSGTTTGNITLSSKLTYSFGGPSQGATGKFFRGGLLNFFF